MAGNAARWTSVIIIFNLYVVRKESRLTLDSKSTDAGLCTKQIDTFIGLIMFANPQKTLRARSGKALTNSLMALKEYFVS